MIGIDLKPDGAAVLGEGERAGDAADRLGQHDGRATVQNTKGLGMTLIDWHFGADEVRTDLKDTDAEQAGQAALEARFHLGRVGIATPYVHRITHFRQLRRQSLAWNGNSRQG
ncbi:hypothetical protein GCM10011320_40600 [Neoroseomonas lacus]|uniref:Uncharacterized protein n=1 Tax=Neoroseomonas lacus TaxID=287609 RepID=A0A917KWD2_9PROT|nr:hypothetical protein GCM10011320_40600 [Neoroseomonas lacus]